MEGWTMIRTRYHEGAVTHCLRVCDSTFDFSHIARTTRPSGLALSLGSGPGSVCADAGGVPTIMSTSMDGPGRPSFWHLTAVGVDSGDFSVFVSARSRLRAYCTAHTWLTPVDSLLVTLV
jgi:hypothetical protein